MDIKKIAILDTSYFIKLKPLDSDTTYYTTEYIIRELKDEKARNFYKLNKDFIQVRNPIKETMHIINRFAKSAGDLSSLSIPDISILALAYEFYKEKGQMGSLRKDPIQYKVEKFEIIKQEKQKKEKFVFNWEEADNEIKTLNSNNNENKTNPESEKDKKDHVIEKTVELIQNDTKKRKN
jgi:RNA-binding protein NOB1